MKVIKILFILAITMALTLTLTITNISEPASETTTSPHWDEEPTRAVTLKRPVSRFLAEKAKNPRAADHCKKDNDICEIIRGKNSKCCNNKCMDLDYDKHNCGACKNKCLYTQICCGGECVDLNYDKRHCGKCDNKCKHAGYCIYGMCDYA